MPYSHYRRKVIMQSVDTIKKASLITAIKTPYLTSGDIDLPSFDALVERQIHAGVDGIVVGGTTGEGQLMNWEEHLMLIAHTVAQFSGRILIIGNTGSNNTREAIKATKYGFATGMDASLQINPYYGRTSEQGVLTHFNQLLDIGPAFIYNVPGRTGQDISPDIMLQLATHKHFIGVKECAGHQRIADYEKQGIACWSGNDDEAHDSRHLYHSHGVISVISNVLPEVTRALMDSKNDALNQSIQSLVSWLFIEPNPIPVNTLLALTGAVKPVFRLPYVPLKDELIEQGIRLISEFDTEQRVGDQLMKLSQDDFKLI